MKKKRKDDPPRQRRPNSEKYRAHYLQESADADDRRYDKRQDPCLRLKSYDDCHEAVSLIPVNFRITPAGEGRPPMVLLARKPSGRAQNSDRFGAAVRGKLFA
jgi:hypothetical protein